MSPAVDGVVWYYRRYIRPTSPVNITARRQLVRSSSTFVTAAAAAAACHAEHETHHYYRFIDSQDGLASVARASQPCLAFLLSTIDHRQPGVDRSVI